MTSQEIEIKFPSKIEYNVVSRPEGRTVETYGDKSTALALALELSFVNRGWRYDVVCANQVIKTFLSRL